MANRFFRAGGFATDTPSDIIVLDSHAKTSGRVSTFIKSGTSAGYQITSGKTFYIVKIVLTVPDGAAGNDSISLGYADNDVGTDTTTARTNPVSVLGLPEQTSVVDAGGILFNASILSTMELIAPQFGNLLIPVSGATKYLYMKYIGSTNAVSVQLYGYEA